MTFEFLVDEYPGDGKKDWPSFIAAGPPWFGAIFKITQGIRYEYAAWAAAQRAPFLLSDRYGDTLFDGFYHFLELQTDGRAQAEWALKHVTMAGGEQRGTIWMMLDVERGGQTIQTITKQIVDDRAGSFSTRWEQLTGTKPTLYGGELLRSVGEHGLLGCGRSAIARYTATLPEQVVIDTGTTEEDLLLWQYTGGTKDQTADNSLRGAPLEAPGCGRTDISVVTKAGGIAAMAAQLAADRAAAPGVIAQLAAASGR